MKNEESFSSKVRRVFAEAVYVPESKRSAYLDEVCKHDQEVRDEVESLLAVDVPMDEEQNSMAEMLRNLGEVDLEKNKEMDALQGKDLSRYVILEKIGSGGMSVVFKARDKQLNRTVALKFLAFHLGNDDQFKKRFFREARAVAALDHPNICYVHEISETDEGQLFIAMAYYEGKTLKEIIAEGPVEEQLALDYFMQVLNGLASAHKAGIIHRDLKPANVIITTDGVAKIIDFGLAKIEGGTQITRKGSKMGTPIYMSPEQILDSTVDQRADIWAAGMLLYELLTGQHPFLKEDDQSTISSIMQDEVIPLASYAIGVDTGLEHVVRKALSRDLVLRYQRVEEIIDEVQQYQGKYLVRSHVEQNAKRGSADKRLLYLGGAVVFFVLLYGLWVLFN